MWYVLTFKSLSACGLKGTGCGWVSSEWSGYPFLGSLLVPRISLTSNCEGHQSPQASSLLYLHLLLISSHFSSLNMPSTPYDSQIDPWPGPLSWTWLEYIPLLTRPSRGHLTAISSVSHPKLWSSLKTCCFCQLPHVGKWQFHPMVSSAKDLRVILGSFLLSCCSSSPSVNPIHWFYFPTCQDQPLLLHLKTCHR